MVCVIGFTFRRFGNERGRDPALRVCCWRWVARSSKSCIDLVERRALSLPSVYILDPTLLLFLER